MRFTLVAALVLIVIACSSGSEPDRSSPELGTPKAPIEALRDCGREDRRPLVESNVDARECLARAFREGAPARLVLVHYTVEGAPITDTITVEGPQLVHLERDSRDPLGVYGVRRATCSTLALGRSGLLELTACRGDLSETRI